jgi:hypothetical protein
MINGIRGDTAKGSRVCWTKRSDICMPNSSFGLCGGAGGRGSDQKSEDRWLKTDDSVEKAETLKKLKIRHPETEDEQSVFSVVRK